MARQANGEVSDELKRAARQRLLDATPMIRRAPSEYETLRTLALTRLPSVRDQIRSSLPETGHETGASTCASRIIQAGCD